MLGYGVLTRKVDTMDFSRLGDDPCGRHTVASPCVSWSLRSPRSCGSGSCREEREYLGGGYLALWTAFLGVMNEAI